MRRFWIGLLLVVLIVSGIRFAPGSQVQAQGGDDPCTALAAQALTAAKPSCAGLAAGQACFGYAEVTATGSSSTTLAASGDKVALADLESLVTSAARPDASTWGLATVMLPAGLPQDSGQAVTAVLFGEAQIARPAQAVSNRPTLTVYNSGGAAVNLRNGAGVAYDLVGQLAPGEKVTADGRNEQGDWVRIQFSGGIGWVFVPVIRWDGDQSALDALDVLAPNDVTPPVQAGAPFQSFTLTTGSAAVSEAACSAAPSGLLLQYKGDQAAQLQIDQVTLDFSDATLLLTAAANSSLDVKVLAGSSTVTARGVPQQAKTGEVVSVSLGGDDGLTPTDAPSGGRSYPFADVAYAPFDLLPANLSCRVGLPSKGTRVTLRVGPGANRGELGDMNANATYAVTGWANDPDGAPWWQLDTASEPSWVAQADVHALGTCDRVAQVEAPPMVLAVPPAPTGAGAPAGGPDLAPTGNSVWEMVPGTDNLTGQCSGTPAINFCDHLAAIAPTASGITWRGMEPSPYPLTRVQPNVYSYSGPNIQGTGNVTMILTFSSDTALNMTMTVVLNSEPNCQHVYHYTGTRNW